MLIHQNGVKHGKIRKFEKVTNMWKSYNTFLNNQGVNEEIKEKLQSTLKWVKTRLEHT